MLRAPNVAGARRPARDARAVVARCATPAQALRDAIPAIVLALLLSSCCFGGAGQRAPRPDARMARIAEEVQRELPDVQRRFVAMGYDEGFAAGAELSQRGLPRLPDGELVAYGAMRARLLESSEAACAAMVGGGDAHAAVAAMDTLSDDLRAFLRLTTHAQSLELQGGPRPMSAEAAATATEAGVARIRAALSEPERAAWDAAIISVAPADACTVERLAMRGTSRLPEGAAILRALLEVAQAPAAP